jgi:hypothetical protein
MFVPILFFWIRFHEIARDEIHHHVERLSRAGDRRGKRPARHVGRRTNRQWPKYVAQSSWPAAVEERPNTAVNSGPITGLCSPVSTSQEVDFVEDFKVKKFSKKMWRQIGHESLNGLRRPRNTSFCLIRGRPFGVTFGTVRAYYE